MDLSEKAKSQNEDIDTVESLQFQLADCRAQLEHWQGVATICELSKQEELGELQRQCDQEIQSLQEALRETASQYEARISTLQCERAQWRKNGGITDKSSVKKGRGNAGTCASESQTSESPTNSFQEPEARIQSDRPYSLSAELESEGTGLLMEGYFSQHCDSASLSSFSLDTPALPRRSPPQDDTASLVSTGTLVPEAIYLPPPGHRLVTHSDWDALNAQVAEQQGELSQLREEREQLERELETQTAETQKQVSVLQFQVQTSEGLLLELQKSFSQSQNAVQSRLSALSLSQRRMCMELSRLKGQETVETDEGGDTNTSFSPVLQGAHCEERLRIEIVNLKEQLDTRAEESEVLEAVQPEDGDGAHPVPEGEAAGGTPGLPHRAAGPPGGTFTPAGRQQSPQQ
ncbi:rab GTPase-binding effector protein 2 isoform X2 [Hypomesus transpacificus]|uniref:rab GTPase-binding effector protein 2 isoform X2 n=1 Tax=Hypomesus transpacificus TaxID=137520 RepID=UPI001F0783AC|nr:rab GTPase-binding effector protein 2 isoform X2 [Hypomesus transpacificus]